jgi:hypothetical protein
MTFPLGITRAAITFAITAGACCAQTDRELKYWSDIVLRRSLEEIVEMRANGRPVVWPRLRSFKPADGPSEDSDITPASPKRLAIGMASALSSYSRKYNDHEFDRKSLEQRFATYRSIRSMLKQSGGYSNLVLADAAYRMTLFELCRSVILYPDRWPEFAQSLSAVRQVSFDTVEIGSMIDEEVKRTGTAEKLSSVSSTKLFETSLQLSGTSLEAIGADHNHRSPTTSALLERRSLGSLLFRLAGADELAEFGLPGLIGFLRKGGNFIDLETSRMEPFTRIMGSSWLNYRFDLLGERGLYPDYLLLLVKTYKATDALPVFYRWAIE